MSDAEHLAYLAALKLLARRDLSETQVRDRLARRGHDQPAIEAAVARLTAERAIDDSRIAARIARTERAVRGRGAQRVREALERAGVPPDVAARHAADDEPNDGSGPAGEAARLDAAIARRLQPDETIADQRGFERLFRALVRQGFEPEAVMDALRRRAAPGVAPA